MLIEGLGPEQSSSYLPPFLVIPGFGVTETTLEEVHNELRAKGINSISTAPCDKASILKSLRQLQNTGMSHVVTVAQSAGAVELIDAIFDIENSSDRTSYPERIIIALVNPAGIITQKWTGFRLLFQATKRLFSDSQARGLYRKDRTIARAMRNPIETLRNGRRVAKANILEKIEFLKARGYKIGVFIGNKDKVFHKELLEDALITVGIKPTVIDADHGDFTLHPSKYSGPLCGWLTGLEPATFSTTN